MWRTFSRVWQVGLVGLAIGAGCAPLTRARRVLAPETFVTPVQPTGEIASVRVAGGFTRTDPEGDGVPFSPPATFVRDGEVWIEPLAITDRGWVQVEALRPDATLRVYTRHLGLVQRDFRPVVARSGTLRGELPTVIRFLPGHGEPLGDEPYRLYIQDLHDVYNEERVEDGDLLLIEVEAPGAGTERYLLRSFEFGLRTRLGAGVLLRAPIPWLPEQRDVGLSPALTASLAVSYRLRSERPGWSFVGEQLAILMSVGVGSTVLEDVDTNIDAQLTGAFNAALIGGGIEAFKIVGVQILGNASAPLRDDLESGWTLAIGLDAVQLGRFADNIGSRLLFEHPLREDR